MEDPKKSELSDEELVVPTALWTFYPSLPRIPMPGFHIPPLRGWRSVVFAPPLAFNDKPKRL